MQDIGLAALITSITFSALSAVYVWSADTGRRARALRLLKLILGRGRRLTDVAGDDPR
jgi:hypothetical protein